MLLAPALSAKRQKVPAQVSPPDLLLEGGRKLTYERSFSSEKDIRGNPGFWTKLVDVVAGEPDYKKMVRPYSVAVDSRGRVIVSDPGMTGVHIFDVERRKYKFLERKEKSKDPMIEPQCVAVDAKDNIYVTDSKAGKVFMWDQQGKYLGVLGSLKGGEGLFKRPTGIAIDTQTQQIYVTDTLRDKIYVLDSNGQTLRTIGQRGSGDGEFNFPTEILMRDGVLAVVDAMNFRVQMFDRNGTYKGAIGSLGDRAGGLFRPKGIALDSEAHIYLVEGMWGVVQVFDRTGQLLYTFGGRGTRLGEFQLPAGLFIDQNDRVYVADSFNQRIQVFQYHGVKVKAEGAKQ
ncbi:MAG TPA: 6-bladed beta-propeller [Clostridia bacterium]|nr:6-bladed beta-propeller [Clostridia bacterium]